MSLTDTKRIFITLLIVNAVLILLIFLAGCSAFEPIDKGPQPIEMKDPPPGQKWVFTVVHYDNEENQIGHYVSDRTPLRDGDIFIVYDGHCIEYRITGTVVIRFSTQYVGGPNPEGVCV